MAQRALIAGAGVAGLTLALALAKRGVASHVVERAAALEETGAGVQLSPNASRILDGLGLGPALDAAATRPSGVSISDATSGRLLKSLPLGEKAERRWGAPYRVVHRADLQTTLIEAVRAETGVEITLDAEAREARETPDGVSLDLDGPDGPRTIEGDWLAGCDGLRSTVRRAAKLPTALRGSGLTAWRAVLPAADVPAAFDMSRVTLWFGPGAHVVVYPVRRGREANVVAIGDDRAPSPESLARNWAGPGRDLIAAGTSWTAWPLYDREPDARMRQGRIALLGDASHAALPSLAQGAAFAIEDAAVLARLVAGDERDPLGRYQDARLARVMRLQARSRRQMAIDHLSGIPAYARNLALAAAPTPALLSGLDWIYGWRDVA